MHAHSDLSCVWVGSCRFSSLLKAGISLSAGVHIEPFCGPLLCATIGTRYYESILYYIYIYIYVRAYTNIYIYMCT